MTVEHTVFTPGRENERDEANRVFHQAVYDMLSQLEQRRSDGYARLYGSEEARKNDYYSLRGPHVVVLKGVPGFERHGKRFVRMFLLDTAAKAAGAPRGAAVGTKPDPARKQLVKKWWEIQGPREDAYAFDSDGKDVPLRAVLGGKQVFTPCVKTEIERNGTTT
jgi:hypothetical protein